MISNRNCLTTAVAAVTMIASPLIHADKKFDLEGLELGMTVEEIHSVLQDLVEDPREIRETLIAVTSPSSGSKIEESVQVGTIRVSINSSPRDTFVIQFTKKPMKVVAAKITRFISYTADDQMHSDPACSNRTHYLACDGLGPSYPVYQSALAEQYGNPIFELHSTMRYASGPVDEACMERIALYQQGNQQYLLPPPARYYVQKEMDRYDSCPEFLDAEIEYLSDRDDQPSIGARFELSNWKLLLESETGYNTYWSQWIADKEHPIQNSQAAVH